MSCAEGGTTRALTRLTLAGPCSWTPALYRLSQVESTFCSLLAAARLLTNSSSEGKPLFTLIILDRMVWPLPIEASESARSHSRSPEPRGTKRSRATGLTFTQMARLTLEANANAQKQSDTEN